MSALHVEEKILRPAEDVVDVLASRPSTWLRPFFRLSLTGAADIAPSPERAAGGWFRLGAPTPVDDGVALSVIWRPHVDGDLFELLRGRLVVRSEGPDAVVALEAQVTGGSPEKNDGVLRSLIRTLAAAMSADQSDGG